MSAPLAPVLILPVNGKKYTTGVVEFSSNTPLAQWQVFTPDAGSVINAYALRRKLLPAGAFEYWNATTPAWQSTEVFNTVTAQANGTVMIPYTSSTIVLGFGSGAGYKQYQFAARVQTSGVPGPYCNDVVYGWQGTTPTFTLTQPSSGAVLNTTRPTVAWVWGNDNGNRQKRYRVLWYTSTVYLGGGFDVIGSAASAVYDTGWITDSAAFSNTIGTDLAAGPTYRAYVVLEDDAGMIVSTRDSTGYTVSAGLPPAPTVSAVANTAGGYVDVTLTSAFNLLDANTSSFISNTGSWADLQLSAISREAFDPVIGIAGGPVMRVDAAGITFAAMQALHTTFAAQNTAYASFNAQKNDQQGGNPIISTPTGLAGIPVLPSTVYSFTTQVRNSSGTGSHRAIIKWYKSDGSPTALTPTVNGTTTAANASTYTEIPNKNVTSPVDAAFVAIQIESITMPVGNYMYMKAAALAKAADVFWSPGGSSAGITFVLERSVGGGAYKPVWGASRTYPASPLTPVLSTIIIRDKAYPMGRSDVVYRAYAVSTSGGNLVSSLPSISAGPALIGDGWLRDYLDGTRDMQVLLASWDRSIDIQATELVPEGATGAIVLHGNQPNVSRFTLEHWSKTQADYDKIMALLSSKRTLHLQRPIGGECYFVRVVGRIRSTQLLSTPAPTDVALTGMVHKISADLTVVQDVEVPSATIVG